MLGGRELTGRRLAGAALGVALVAAGDVPAGVLTFGDATSIFTTGRAGLGNVGAVTVSPDGRNVYATTVRDGLLDGPALTVLGRDDEGTLHFVQVYSEGPAPTVAFCGAGQVVVSPDGRNVYVAATCSERVHTFARDPIDGHVTSLGELVHEEGRPDGLSPPHALVVSPDGTHVYTGIDGDGGLGVLRRDPVSGVLTWQEGQRLPDRRRSGYAHTTGLAISPDGTSLYVPEWYGVGLDDALHVFRREPATGALSLVETLRDGTPPFVALSTMTNAVVSPDGRHVYAGVSFDLDAVMVVFRRDAASGRLTPIQIPPRETPFVPTTSLAMSPDGRLLFAGGDYTLTVLRRDVVTGTVSTVESREHVTGANDGLYLIGGLSQGQGVAVDALGHDVYTAAANESSIGRYHRSCPDGVLDPDEACDDANDADGDGCNALCQVEPCFSCEGTPSVCVPLTGTACDDANACTETSTCTQGVCTSGAVAADGTSCDDGNACTTGDECRSGTCSGGAPPDCTACEGCDPRWGCVGTLRSGCVVSREVGPAGMLQLDADASRIRFRWAGAKRAYAPAALGDPTSGTAWTLCVFDTTGGNVVVRRRRRSVLTLQIPAGGTCNGRPCWRRSGKGFRYRDPDGMADGVTRMTLAAPAPDRTLTLTARGPLDGLGALPLALPATVELRNSDGACWAQGWGAYVHRNDSNRFVGRGGLSVPCHGRCTE